MALNNIGNMMKIMNAWNIFKRNHPKLPAFCNAVSKRALKEGSIMAITVTTPDGEKIETNLRIKAEDLEPVSYTHLDVYKRQQYFYQTSG